MSHSSQLPVAVAQYGALVGGWARYPYIDQYFRPEEGWKYYPFRKRISPSWARKLKADGVTVALTDGRRHADFQVSELQPRARRRTRRHRDHGGGIVSIEPTS